MFFNSAASWFQLIAPWNFVVFRLNSVFTGGWNVPAGKNTSGYELSVQGPW